MLLATISCGKEDFVSTGYSTSAMKVEYMEITEANAQLTSKTLTDTTILSYANVKMKYNQEAVSGTLGLLNSGNLKVKRVAVLGVDSLIYGYADVIETSPKVYEATYFHFNGKPYMKAILKNNVIEITETYFDSLSGARPNGWFGRFNGCVENFVHRVTNDAELAAIMVVGAAYAPHYVLAGLGIGCAIHASTTP